MNTQANRRGAADAWRQAVRTDRRARRCFIAALLLPGALLLAAAVVAPAVQLGRGMWAADTTAAPAPADATAPADEAADGEEGGDAARARYRALEVQAQYLTVRLENARLDSITLAVDLVDSTVTLEIDGVPLRRCKILALDVSRSLRRQVHGGRTPVWTAAAFVLQREAATLPKAPVRTIEAPKDTTEAQQRALLEIPEDREDANFKLWFDRGVTLTVTHAATTPGNVLEQQLFGLRTRWQATWAALAGSFTGAEPEHGIHLELTPADARAVYRALPPRARMALRV